MSSSQLSQSDIENLLKNPSDAVRKEIAAKVAKTLASSALGENERAIAESIVRKLLTDTSVSVRRALAEDLKGAAALARDIAVELAGDADAVAVPMLMAWPGFTDAELDDFISAGTRPKRIAIASRAALSPVSAAALLGTGDAAVAASLAGNPSLTLTDPLLDSLVEGFGSREEVQEALLGRADLPLTVAERLIALVSERLRAYLRERHSFADAQAEALAVQSRERATLELLESGTSAEQADSLVKHLKDNGRLTASLVFRALCSGSPAFVDAATAEFFGLVGEDARALFGEGGCRALDEALSRAGLTGVYRRVFVAAFEAYAVMDAASDADERRARLVRHVVAECDGVEGETLDELMKALMPWSEQARAA